MKDQNQTTFYCNPNMETYNKLYILRVLPGVDEQEVGQQQLPIKNSAK